MCVCVLLRVCVCKRGLDCLSVMNTQTGPVSMVAVGLFCPGDGGVRIVLPRVTSSWAQEGTMSSSSPPPPAQTLRQRGRSFWFSPQPAARRRCEARLWSSVCTGSRPSASHGQVASGQGLDSLPPSWVSCGQSALSFPGMRRDKRRC